MRGRKRQRKKDEKKERGGFRNFCAPIFDDELDAIFLDLFFPAASGKKSLRELGW